MQPSVIIAGGGMAGTLLALALDTLSQGRVRIDVIEAQLPQAMSGSGFDARCIALAHGSCQQLEQLGLWAPLAAHAAPIRRIHGRRSRSRWACAAGRRGLCLAGTRSGGRAAPRR